MLRERGLLMKILVLSDSHGFTDMLEAILRKERDADIIIHLGDGGADMLGMNHLTAGKPVYQIKGNCDISAYNFSPKLISSAEDVRFFACHGHMYNVKHDVTALYFAASEANCSLALFGHTHIQFSEDYKGVTLFNPGSVMNGKYGIVTVNGKDIKTEHKKTEI